MSHTYVGVTPRTLLTGRPVVFGTVLEESDLALADEATRAGLVPPVELRPIPLPPAPEQAPKEVAPAPAPAAPAEQPAPAPQEVVTTGNPPATPEPEAE